MYRNNIHVCVCVISCKINLCLHCTFSNAFAHSPPPPPPHIHTHNPTERFKDSVIEERKKSAEALLYFATYYQHLAESQPLRQFLSVSINSYMYIHTHIYTAYSLTVHVITLTGGALCFGGSFPGRHLQQCYGYRVICYP